jgi:hypothetical protein
MLVALWMLAACSVAVGQAPVTVTETDTSWVMSNAFVAATISKTTGDMVSL